MPASPWEKMKVFVFVFKLQLKVSNTTLLFIFTVAALNHVPHFLCAGRPGTWKSFRAADRATEDLNGGAGESNRMARL